MDISQVSQLIKQLLDARSPEIGARLKQRLNAVLADQGQSQFDEKAFGFRKFSDFLEKTQVGILKVERTSQSADIVVSLLSSPPSVSQVSKSLNETDSAAIRSDVWQAFTNGNLQRKRFLNKGTFELKHFVENDQSLASQEVLARRDHFIEIQPVSAATQLEWMRDYLRTVPLHATDKSPLEAMAEQPYTSNLNAVFTRALGDKGVGWRHFRTQRVSEVIAQWALQHGVPLERLRKPVMHLPADGGVVSKENSRTRAQSLLQLISDEDIAKVVIPVLLTTLLIRKDV